MAVTPIMDPSPPKPRRPVWGVIAALYVLALLFTAFWQPLVALVLSVLGILYLVFRLVDLDATTVLSIYLLFLMLLPASYVVPSVGAAGTPANALALGCGYWWILQQTAPSPASSTIPRIDSLQPLRVALMVFMLTTAASFVVAFARPLTSVESNGAARSLLSAAGLTGVALLASDGIVNRDRLDVIINRILNVAGLMAIVACLQFFTDFDPVLRWRVPGLELNRDLLAVSARSVVNRVASTTLHPIEFGGVVAMLLPLALHTAFYCEKRLRFRRWARVGLLGLALPLSVSRTAVVILAVALLMMWPAWKWARRLWFLAGSIVFLLVVRGLVSGLLGTIVSLFTSINEDPSTSGRTDDYEKIWVLWGERPLFGRGLGTFDPVQYFFLDNQLLMTLVTGGLVALGGLVFLVVVGTSVSRQVYWHALDEETQHLGATIAASVVGAFFGFATFDALGFPVFAGLFFLLIGIGGAAWRIEVMPHGRTYANRRHRKQADA